MTDNEAIKILQIEEGQFHAFHSKLMVAYDHSQAPKLKRMASKALDQAKQRRARIFALRQCRSGE